MEHADSIAAAMTRVRIKPRRDSLFAAARARLMTTTVASSPPRRSATASAASSSAGRASRKVKSKPPTPVVTRMKRGTKKARYVRSRCGAMVKSTTSHTATETADRAESVAMRTRPRWLRVGRSFALGIKGGRSETALSRRAPNLSPGTCQARDRPHYNAP